jgi:hypothetical protein
MEKYSPEEFENILKEKSDQYMLYPSDRVWNNILDKLHPFRRVKYFSLLLLFLTAATTAIILSDQESRLAIAQNERISHAFMKNNHFEELSNNQNNEQTKFTSSGTRNQKQISAAAGEVIGNAQRLAANIELGTKKITLPIPNQISVAENSLQQSINDVLAEQEKKEGEKHNISNALENVIEKAKKIKKNARWQLYVTPSISYRSLSGQASKSVYQYSQYFLATNAPFARDVKDAVNHSPGIGLEVGASMYYPITKRLSFKAGFQANYNQYKIKAFSSVPEIATYGMNNFRAGSIPINAVSVYRNNAGYSNATLRNEHYMLSIPIGFDYRILGNKKVNLSVASTIQPSYIFANYSYLISTNLRNYAKAPDLNRKLNVNGAMEASLNFNSGGFKWSIGPQYRYQLMSSFKNKYPIRENLMDFGIKLGVIKTIK